MILENYNVLKEQGIIATKTNKFEGETIMYSFHCYPPKKGMFDLSNIKPDILLPIDVLYKSKQSAQDTVLHSIYSALRLQAQRKEHKSAA